MAETPVTINRAPVLTLWASVVAERMGHDRDVSLTLGKAVAGLNAYSKGRHLGIYGEPKKRDGEGKRAAQVRWVSLCGRDVPVVDTPDGARAVTKERPLDPAGVQRYLESKFGGDLVRAREAFADLAASFDPDVLAERAYSLYEKFRPRIPAGKRGWGAAGLLDLDFIRSLKQNR